MQLKEFSLISPVIESADVFQAIETVIPPDVIRPLATPSLFKWRHFLPDVILLNIRWYCRYPLSYRNLEEMMQERGVVVDHSTINRTCIEVRPRILQTHSPSAEPHQRLVAS